MNSDVPKFAVIGRINKGKSSIVSTLAEDDSVAIDSIPGTTKFCREYPVRVDGRTLLIFIDTPGFQQAPRALSWLREHEVSAANRREVVAQFLNTFRHSNEFTDECRLLEPILAGSGILYVVDGAKPFRRNYEAEMEILRWTGQPRMALINHIGEGDFSHEWQPALDQYFSIVRSFNAHQVSFGDRLQLLRAFRELNVAWRGNLDQAIRYLQDEWARRARVTARIIARLLIDQLTFYQDLVLEKDELPQDHKARLEEEFHNYLRKKEQKARRETERLYQHLKLETEEEELEKPVFEQDLFAKSTWNLLGLTAKQLISAGVIAGATVGAALDAAVGGASFLTGTILGGAIGGTSVFYYSAKRLATFKNIKNYLQGSQVIRIGPHQNQNFPWIILDRALLHYKSVRDLAHSRREKLALLSGGDKTGIVSELDSQTRKTLARLFSAIRKKHFGDYGNLEKELETEIGKIIKKN